MPRAFEGPTCTLRDTTLPLLPVGGPQACGDFAPIYTASQLNSCPESCACGGRHFRLGVLHWMCVDCDVMHEEVRR